MASNLTVSDLLKSKEVTDAQVRAAVDALLANPRTGPFDPASDWVLDLTAAMKADRHATAALKEPTARPGRKRAAIKSAILLAHLVKG